MFSFAINCFNEELHIFNCIYSIYNLTDDIVIINNNSTDNTDQEIKKFIQLYDLKKKITYIKENTNLTIAEARNKALDLCKNEFIVKWDGDFISYNVEYCLNYIKKNEENNILFDLYLWSAPNLIYDIEFLDKNNKYAGFSGDQFISRKNSICYFSGNNYPDEIHKNKKIRINYFLKNQTINCNNYYFFHWYKIKPLKYFIYRLYWPSIHLKKIDYKDIYTCIENISGQSISELTVKLKNDILKRDKEFFIKHNDKNILNFVSSYNIILFKYGNHCILKDYKNDYIEWQHNELIKEKFEKEHLSKINKEIVIYEKSFLMHHCYYNNFKHFTETFNILEHYLNYKYDKKLLVLHNCLYNKIKPIIDILHIDFKNIIILEDNIKYNFKNLIYNNKHYYGNIYNDLKNLSFIKTLIDNIELSENLNYTKYNKIYLKRGSVKKRVLNENLIIDYLKDMNYKIIEFTNESDILEQIYTIYYANEIIVTIGAGCNNIIMKNKDCIFKCLIPKYNPYKSWANIYKNFENFKIIECGDIVYINEQSRCDSEWILNDEFKILIKI